MAEFLNCNTQQCINSIKQCVKQRRNLHFTSQCYHDITDLKWTL